MYSQSGYPYSPYAGYGYAGGGYPASTAAGYTPGAQMPAPPGFTQQFQPQVPPPDVPGMLPLEQSYIENILRLNRGKVGTFYMTFENNERWNAKVFKGIVEAAGRDHIILSDPQTGKRYLLLMVNLDYATFDEELDYDYPYPGMEAAQSPELSTYSPR
ncbi:spore germination protein Q [Evansella caseinilytica]|uniref:Spore germination protein Q n=1 Tax=Evansella caseinilytica TaxID=1503961 RepID=A0A1H3UYE4_9BACI|nr:spore coat protein GerQ [Evansella caseinilytica]SDZ66815.1 spore germination protein Q [Evansella caseinilytica]